MYFTIINYPFVALVRLNVVKKMMLHKKSESAIMNLDIYPTRILCKSSILGGIRPDFNIFSIVTGEIMTCTNFRFFYPES